MLFQVTNSRQWIQNWSAELLIRDTSTRSGQNKQRKLAPLYEPPDFQVKNLGLKNPFTTRIPSLGSGIPTRKMARYVADAGRHNCRWEIFLGKNTRRSEDRPEEKRDMDTTNRLSWKEIICRLPDGSLDLPILKTSSGFCLFLGGVNREEQGMTLQMLKTWPANERFQLGVDHVLAAYTSATLKKTCHVTLMCWLDLTCECWEASFLACLSSPTLSGENQGSCGHRTPPKKDAISKSPNDCNNIRAWIQEPNWLSD